VDRIDPRFVDDYACGSGVWSWNVGYNTTLFPAGKEPKSWPALFDFDQYPGVRAIGDRVNPMLEVALLADGVAPADLYPLDVDRAFKKLDTLKGKSIFWSTHAQCLQLLASGEAALGLSSSTRMFAGKRDGAPVAASWEKNLQTGAFLAVVKGSTSADLGWVLIDEMTKPENQAIVAKRIGLSPTNLKAFDHIDADVAKALPTAPDNIKQSVLIDETYWQDHAVELEERWTAWKLA
jgi:putative spermidine/putrescine transport system substrate-binding protein